MKPATPKIERQPSTERRKAVFGGSLMKYSCVIILSVLSLLWAGCNEKRNAQQNAVWNALKQIEGAKMQWGIEQAGMLSGVQPSKNFNREDIASSTPDEADLKPYLHRGSLPPHPSGGRFIINPLGKPAESTVFGTAQQILDRQIAEANKSK